MEVPAVAIALAATVWTVYLIVRIAVLRVDDACRLAELVRETRALRARHRAALLPPRPRHR